MTNWITHSSRPVRALALAVALGVAMVMGLAFAPVTTAQAQQKTQAQRQTPQLQTTQVHAAQLQAAQMQMAQQDELAGPGAGPEIVMGALAYLGVPYRYGGNDAVTGFDCSGLVRQVFLSATSLELPRSAHEMARQGVPVGAGDLRPGDLVFFNTRGRPHSHVGIYIGEGRFVHAPARRGVVKVESMEPAYWQRRFNGARRIVPAGAMAPDQFSAPQVLPAVFLPGPVPPECASCER